MSRTTDTKDMKSEHSDRETHKLDLSTNILFKIKGLPVNDTRILVLTIYLYFLICREIFFVSSLSFLSTSFTDHVIN